MRVIKFIWNWYVVRTWWAIFPPRSTDCQLRCDDDCEVGYSIHCWNWHRPKHKPDFHDPKICDASQGRRRF